MNTVSQNLKRIRIEKGLTQQQMADKLFVTQQTISNWEKGKAMPAVDQLADIAHKLGVDIYELMYGFDEDKEYAKKKMKYSAITGLVFFGLWQSLVDTARQLQYYQFDQRLTMLIAFVLRPVALFMLTYALVMLYRTKVKTLPKARFPFAKWVKLAIMVFMVFVPLTILVWFFGWIDLTRAIWVKNMFLLFWDIASKGSWVYAVLGMIYARCDQSKEKNKD